MLTGGCQCGAVRYEIDGPPAGLFVCHCLEWKKQSASAFGVSVPFQRDHFRMTKGAVNYWERKAASGNTVVCAFCGTCGSRVWHEPANAPTMLRVRGGSLDQPPDLTAAVHIWTSRKLAGVSIPEGARQFPAEPD